MDTQHIGKAEVINCEFEYECPLDWFKLATTDDASIRHCGACNKDVYFCRDTEQLALLLRYIPDACAARRSRSRLVIAAHRPQTDDLPMADDLEANLRAVDHLCKVKTVYVQGWYKNVLAPAEFVPNVHKAPV